MVWAAERMDEFDYTAHSRYHSIDYTSCQLRWQGPVGGVYHGNRNAQNVHRQPVSIDRETPYIQRNENHNYQRPAFPSEQEEVLITSTYVNPPQGQQH